MFGGIDPKKMQQVMKQMGIKQEAIDALRVVIEQEDGRIVIERPSVMKVVMQGQESWQITGEARAESAEEGVNEDDIHLVMDKTGKEYAAAKSALEENEGDIAAAIVALS
jgi:nascent polypeptide-associated complex subunit alpha